MTTYNELAQKTRSEKITLITIESVQRAKIFTPELSNWARNCPFFVVGVKDDGVSLVKGTDWEFYPTQMKLVIIGGANPKTRKLSLTYRHFFSTSSINLPFDLNDGEVVYFDGRVKSIGSIGQQLDDENTGIVLESSSSVDLINTDGFFDGIFDTHIWENQTIKFYSWFNNLPITEAQLLFDGVIENKSFNENQITFRVKDFVFKLKNLVNLGTYSELDGKILPKYLGKPKRRIYGEADHVEMVSLDAIIDGYALSGTISASIATDIVTGVGTFFLDEVSQNDKLNFVINGEEKEVSVLSIQSNTQLTLDRTIDYAIPSLTSALNKSERPFRKVNRNWHIAGHKLTEKSAEIYLINNNTTFLVNSVEDFKAGDLVTIIDQQTKVRRISGNKIITTTAIIPLPVIGDVIFKRPVKDVYFGTNKLEFERDYTLSNITEAKIQLNNLAEFNIAIQKKSAISCIFTSGSRIVSTTANIDFKNFLRPRDWIKIDDVTYPTWYEILQVDQQSFTVRIPITASVTDTFLYKNVDLIDENSLMTASVLGMERDSKWIRTASDAVKDLVINDSGFTSVNESTFAKAKADADHTLSLVVPESLGGQAPQIRDVITKINESVFGSLYGNNSQNISYSVLNSKKPEIINQLKDDDILSFSIETKQKIINKTIVKYRPYTDIYSGSSANKTFEYTSKFVDDLIGISNTLEKTIYLYDDSSAEIMAQRISLFNSMSSSFVNLKAKMNLFSINVNDKIYLDLDRLYARYGGLDSRKLGTVVGVKKDGFNTEIKIGDLGNIYNRIPSIAPNSTLDYSSANQDDKIKWAYILDNDTETPNATSEEGFGNFIIG